ncbi:ubiquitin-conjugating enzyme e2 27-like [Nannochloropsis oceanica]
MGDFSRIRKELNECARDQKSGVTASPVGSSLNHLSGTITGPDGTPYAKGVFKIDIHIPTSYPFEPPKMKFLTKIWHPNISSQSGAICLDILKDQWSPALTIKTALISLQALLCTPQPDDPQDAEVASMYLNNQEQFLHTAKFWTETYARPEASHDEVVDRLKDMGFSETAARKALEDSNWDETAAVNALLSS